MSEKAICDKCGSEIKYFQEKGSCGWVCPVCGWGCATTYIEPVKSIIYGLELKELEGEAIAYISSCSDESELFLIGYNYNWSGGFDIPKAIISNPACGLSTALMLFYAGDGCTYLTEKPTESELTEWFEFISQLYEKILAENYKKTNIAFNVPLSRVQKYKLSKILLPEESVFITDLDGKNCYIDI